MKIGYQYMNRVKGKNKIKDERKIKGEPLGPKGCDSLLPQNGRQLVAGLTLALFLSILTAGTALAQVSNHEMPEGQRLYMQMCAQCHGQDLQGGGAQSLVDRVWQFGQGRWAIFRNIKHGIEDRGMPAYEDGLNDGQINQIIDFIELQEKTAGTPKPPLPTELSTTDYKIQVKKVVDDLKVPWGMVFLDANTALITERPGRLVWWNRKTGDKRVIEDTPRVLNAGQGGLLDVAVDPNYAKNRYIYLSYSHGLAADDQPLAGNTPAMTRLVRGRIQAGRWVDQEVLFEAKPEHYQRARHHYGSRIAFGPNGDLYFTVGDRGQKENAQKLDWPTGKVHRIKTDGSIPKDNPFVDQPGVYPSIYTYGNRNPQGLAADSKTGMVWETEHGPMGGDEFNFIRSGKNYGWSVITYGRNYNGTMISNLTMQDGLLQPTWIWMASPAMSGLTLYQGRAFEKWQGNLFAGALKFEELKRLVVDEDRLIYEEVILKNAGRVRAVTVSPGGFIYVVLNGPDVVLELSPMQ